MKVRRGYVSNSSSASFIIHWKSRNNREMSLEDAIERMEREYFFGEYGMTKEYIEKVTKENGDGRFTTEFFTSMMNSGDSFGEQAKSFLINIMTSDDFQIYNFKVDKD
jgi:hypothetical protein